MDLNSLLNLLMAGNNPWFVVGGAVLSIVLQRLGVKLPFAPVPVPTPKPASPAPAQPDGTAAPLLLSASNLLDLIRFRKELDRQFATLYDALKPEPTTPAFTPPPPRAV